MQTIDVNAISPTDNLYMIDVRDPQAYGAGHVPGSINVPLDTVRRAAEELKTFPKVLVMCNKGLKAKQAAEILEEVGLRNVQLIGGGLDAWKAAHRPIAASPKPALENAEQLLQLAGVLLLGAGLFRQLRWIAAIGGVILLAKTYQKQSGQPCALSECMSQLQNPVSLLGRLMGWRVEKI